MSKKQQEDYFVTELRFPRTLFFFFSQNKSAIIRSTSQQKEERGRKQKPASQKKLQRADSCHHQVQAQQHNEVGLIPTSTFQAQALQTRYVWSGKQRSQAAAQGPRHLICHAAVPNLRTHYPRAQQGIRDIFQIHGHLCMVVSTNRA